MTDELQVLQGAVRVGDERAPQVADLAARYLGSDFESGGTRGVD